MCGRANSHFLQEGGRLFPNRHQGAPPPSPSIPQHCQTLLQCLFLTRLARVAGLIEPLRWACSSTLGSFLQNMSSSPYSGIFISLRIKFHTNHTCCSLIIYKQFCRSTLRRCLSAALFHTDTEKRAFPLIGNETSRSIIRNAHSRQYFSRQQMAMRWVAPRLTVGSYTAEKTKNTCGPSERSEFKKSCRTVKSWVESALKLIDILQDCKHKSCSCEWFTHP